MQRFTISLDDGLALEFDRLIAQRGYRNRSEAVRDLLRAQLEASRLATGEARHCVANLSYVYNHHERELAERLTAIQHQHHDLTVSTLHAHLDHEQCIESVILRGPTQDVRAFADALMAERGVRHGNLNLVSVEAEHGSHAHAYAAKQMPLGHSPKAKRGAAHLHLKPKS